MASTAATTTATAATTSAAALTQHIGALVEAFGSAWPPRDVSHADTLPLMELVWIPFGAALLYVLMVFCLPSLLAPLYNRNTLGYKTLVLPYVLRPVMIVWNVALAGMSLVMFVGVAVPLYTQMRERYGPLSPLAMVCDKENIVFGQKNMQMYWEWTFGLSKLVELLDTLFLIVKNPTRKVEFLHWYHHTTVLLFCWFAWYYEYSAAVHFLVMNAFIHTLMYTYYALKEIGFNPAWNKMLTKAQIVQMFFGMALVLSFTYEYLATGGQCTVSNFATMNTAGLLMYGSYFFLFVQFYVKRYQKIAAKQAAEKQAKQAMAAAKKL